MIFKDKYLKCSLKHDNYTFKKIKEMENKERNNLAVLRRNVINLKKKKK